ncbi:hypothetical protein ACSSV1_004886 [Labrenzia sp. MBR-25]
MSFGELTNLNSGRRVAAAGENSHLSVVQNNSSGEARANYRPAVEVPQEFITLFDAFNNAFWGGALPDCIFSYTRKSRTLGYYAPERLERTSSETCSEIALNPVFLACLHPIVAMSVLAHEMAHHWRRTLGAEQNSGRRGTPGYHDTVWGAEMKRIGLYPSNTGEPGGKETGQQMMHYIIEGGPFDVLSARLFDEGFRFSWHENISVKPDANFDKRKPFTARPGHQPRPTRKPPTRLKFTCSQCGLNAWAKPQARLACVACVQPMIPNLQK